MNRQGRFQLAPRPGPTVLMLAAVALFASLGHWQLERAAQKRALIEDFSRPGTAQDLRRLPSDAPRFSRVVARGRYDPAHQFLLDNQVHRGRTGVHVLTPLVLGDGSAVLVNRGWLPYGTTRRDLPNISVAAEPREVTGRIDDFRRAPIELDVPPAAGWPRLVQYPHASELAAALGRELAPRVVLLDPWDPDGYVREWAPVTASPPARNFGYAGQWFAFALVAFVAWVVVSRRREGAS